MNRVLFLLLSLPLLVLAGCAALPGVDPIRVTVAGVDSAPGEDLELRMLVKLRVQNPNDAPIAYDGVYVNLEVMDRPFASGVSDARGSIPRFGEAIIVVPVTASVLSLTRQVFGLIDGVPRDAIRYRLTGKLHGPAFATVRFSADGELSLPSAPREPRP